MSSKHFPAAPLPRAGYGPSFQPLLQQHQHLHMNTGDLQVPNSHAAGHQPYTGLLNIAHTSPTLDQKPVASEVDLCFDEQAYRSDPSSEPLITGRFKRWTFDDAERNNLSPLLMQTGEEQAASLHNNQTVQVTASHGGFLPLSSSNTSSTQRVPQPYLARFDSTRSEYSPDLEILRVSQHHTSNYSGVYQQQLYEVVPSSYIMPQQPPHNIGASSTTNYNVSTPTHAYNVQNTASSSQQQQLDWGINSSGNPELLLLPRVVAAASEMSSSKLPLPLNGLDGRQTNNPSPSLAQWSTDQKLHMAVGLPEARSMFRENSLPSVGNSSRQQSAGVFHFLQSPQHRQSNFSLDDGSYSCSGYLGFLQNSKYLKAVQQLLDEICNVRRDAVPLRISHSIANLPEAWNVEGRASASGDHSRDHALNREKAIMSMDLYQNDDRSTRASNHDHKTNSSSEFKSADHHHHHGQSSLHSSQPDSQSPPTDSSSPRLLSADERYHLQMRKSHLIGMVEELDRRYQQYRDHMQLLITSFESATGLGEAAPYTALARRAMSRHFRGLRNAIEDHIHKVCKVLGEELSSVAILSKGETPRLRVLDQRLRQKRALLQIGMLQQQQAWRPQRGLPERSVSVLRSWLFEHFLHPYPKNSEKHMLSRLTGLSKNQVSNWFINARVRLWKPMVEEMYGEESKDVEDADDGINPSDAAGARGEHVGAYGGTMQRSPPQQQSFINQTAPMHADGVALLSTPLRPCSTTHSALEPPMHGFNTSSITKNGVSLTLGLQHSSSSPSSDHSLP